MVHWHSCYIHPLRVYYKIKDNDKYLYLKKKLLVYGQSLQKYGQYFVESVRIYHTIYDVVSLRQS